MNTVVIGTYVYESEGTWWRTSVASDERGYWTFNTPMHNGLPTREAAEATVRTYPEVYGKLITKEEAESYERPTILSRGLRALRHRTRHPKVE